MQFTLLLASSTLYIAGSIGLTIVGNISLNVRLAKFDASKATGNEFAQARAGFEKPWNRLHAIRTIASIPQLCSSSSPACMLEHCLSHFVCKQATYEH